MKLVLLLDKKDIPDIKNDLINLLRNLNGHNLSILTNCDNFESVVGKDTLNANIYHLKRIRAKYFLPGDILIASSKKILRHLKRTDYVYTKVMLFPNNGILKEIMNEDEK